MNGEAATRAARILSLLADGQTAEAWAVIDETVRGDGARETMMALASNAVAPLRIMAERCRVSVEELLMLAPAGDD